MNIPLGIKKVECTIDLQRRTGATVWVKLTAYPNPPTPADQDEDVARESLVAGLRSVADAIERRELL